HRLEQVDSFPGFKAVAASNLSALRFCRRLSDGGPDLVATNLLPAPFLIQIEIVDHPAEDNFGLQQFEFGLNKVGGIARTPALGGPPRNVRLVMFYANAGRALVDCGTKSKTDAENN